MCRHSRVYSDHHNTPEQEYRRRIINAKTNVEQYRTSRDSLCIQLSKQSHNYSTVPTILNNLAHFELELEVMFPMGSRQVQLYLQLMPTFLHIIWNFWPCNRAEIFEKNKWKKPVLKLCLSICCSDCFLISGACGSVPHFIRAKKIWTCTTSEAFV